MTSIRPQSKVAIILQMISTSNGASVSELMEATCSSANRIRAAIADLRMRHIRIITTNESELNELVDYYQDLYNCTYNEIEFSKEYKDINSEIIKSTIYKREEI